MYSNKITNSFLLIIIFFFILLLFSLDICIGQVQINKIDHQTFGVNIGLGSTPNIFEYKPALTIGIIPYYQIGNNLFTFRSIGSFEIIWDGPSPEENVKDFSILYGKCFKNKDIMFSTSIGVGLVKGIKRGAWLGEPGIESYEHEKKSYTTIGLPVDTQLFLISKYIGLGCYLFGNFNTENSFGGFLLCMQLGKIQ